MTDGYQSTCSPNLFTSCVLSSNITVGGVPGYSNLTFLGAASAGLQTLQWGNNINPNSFKPSSTFQIITYVDGWGVEKSNGYIMLTMN